MFTASARNLSFVGQGTPVAEPIHIAESALIRDYLGGDPEAIKVVDGWINHALKHGYRSLQRDWEDLRQEVRTRVFQNLSHGMFEGRSTFNTYVHSITRNVCIDLIRSMHARVDDVRIETSEPAARPEDASLSGCIAQDLLDKIMASLSPRDRRLMHLVHVEQRSYGDLAKLLGVSEGAIKVRVHRCRRRILERRRELLRERTP